MCPGMCMWFIIYEQGVENHSRKEIRLVTKQTLCTGAVFSGSHLSHKEATASRCLQCDFFMGGHRGQKDKHVLSCTGKGAESTWKRTLMRLIQAIHEYINEPFVKGKVFVPWQTQGYIKNVSFLFCLHSNWWLLQCYFFAIFLCSLMSLYAFD